MKLGLSIAFTISFLSGCTEAEPVGQVDEDQYAVQSGASRYDIPVDELPEIRRGAETGNKDDLDKIIDYLHYTKSARSMDARSEAIRFMMISVDSGDPDHLENLLSYLDHSDRPCGDVIKYVNIYKSMRDYRLSGYRDDGRIAACLTE